VTKKTTILAITVVLIVCIYYYWSNLINLMLPADSRPGEITFPVTYVSDQEFVVLARELTENYTEEFKHIDIFRDSNVTTYEGPATCLRCHDDIEITDAMTGEIKKTDLMDNLTGSVHFRFFSSRHPNVYGFNGELADDFDMGKINRPCPKPGSFAMTAWAQLVVFKNGDTLSEGCGQCHIGGQYAAPLGAMMPGYRTMDIEKEAIDCLVCHAAAYDMNYKQVVVDDNGRTRWGQDRTMLAALSVTKPNRPPRPVCAVTSTIWAVIFISIWTIPITTRASYNWVMNVPGYVIPEVSAVHLIIHPGTFTPPPE